MSICILFYEVIKLLSKEKKYRYIGKGWKLPCEGLNLRPGEPDRSCSQGDFGAVSPPAWTGHPTYTRLRRGTLRAGLCPILSPATSRLSRVEFLNRYFHI